MKKILLFLANGFEIYEASVFIDVFGWNFEEGDGNTQLSTCGITPKVKSAFNQQIVVDCLAGDIDPAEFDALAVPGGFEQYGYYKDAYSDTFLNLIREFHNNQKPIASVCVGALPLGKSGLLKNVRATTYNKGETRMSQLKSFGADVIDDPIVRSGNLITSHNPSTAIDVAFILLEILTSEKNAMDVRKLMGFDQ